MNLEEIAREIRNFEGVTRKKPLGELAGLLKELRCEGEPDFGDDAAIVEINGDSVVLLAADGIWGRLMNASPWWAGYTSVLVNVNDIVAMGGVPLAMVNVLSSSDEKICSEILRGMKEGVAKFGVPMVGGHLHPDTPYTALSVAIVGTARRDKLILSSTAKAGDSIVAAFDLDGEVGPNSPFSFNSTTNKTKKELKKLYGAVLTLGEKKLVSAGKDISNPGVLGTLAMLLETSGLGAQVDIDSIPRPDDLNLTQWLKIHPATGFIFTTSRAEESLEVLEKAGFTARIIGKVNNSRILEIQQKGEKTTIFNFQQDLITGVTQKNRRRSG